MDYLKDCMNDVGNPPLDAMHRNFCLVCANRGCERAGMNQSAFDNRAKNWKSILFDNVPRAEHGDPRYSNITSKSFSPGGPVRPPPTTVFMPGVPVIARPEPAARPTAFVRQEEPETAEEEGLELIPTEQAAVVPPGDPAPDVRPEPVASPGNTPFEQGMVLDGAPEATGKPEESKAQGQTSILDDED